MTTATTTATAATQTVPRDPAMEYAVKKGYEGFYEGFTKTFEFANSFSDLIGGVVRTGAGALAATAFTAITPWGGAAYGLTYFAASHAVSWIDDKCAWPDNALTRVVKYALPKIAGIGAGLAVVAAAGFALSQGTVIALVGGTIAFTLLGFATIKMVEAGIGCINGCREGFQAYQHARATYTATTQA